ncbi:hypothetical protein V8G54_022287 [Vigna mungo]|uniref:Uncharacterized protein n=1 Tax=Vigna mungo TaxID=3915 RepID=A0AAQ3RYF9_VIGMU
MKGKAELEEGAPGFFSLDSFPSPPPFLPSLLTEALSTFFFLPLSFLGVSSASRSRITGIGCCEVLQDLRILKPELDELVDGELEFKRERFLCLESLTGVSSTMRVANNSASSSQPAIAAADLNLGDKRVAMSWTLESANGIFWLLGLRFCSPLTAILLFSISLLDFVTVKGKVGGNSRTLTQYRQLF